MVSSLTLRRRAGPLLVSVALIAAIAILAALVLTLRSTPQGTQKTAAVDSAIAAYKTMAGRDMNSVLTAQSNHCDTISDSGCPAAIAHLLVPVNSWLDDMSRAAAPPVFGFVDLQLRRHVTGAIADLNDAVAAFGRKDSTGMSGAISSAAGERDFIEIEVGAIQSSAQVSAANYRDNVRIDNGLILDCTVECVPASGAPSGCARAQRSTCLSQIQATRIYTEQFQAGLVASRAPASLTGADAAIQSDLFISDVALGTLATSLAAGDATELQFANAAYVRERSQLARDVQSVLKP